VYVGFGDNHSSDNIYWVDNYDTWVSTSNIKWFYLNQAYFPNVVFPTEDPR
jgi:hypothetical protein